MTGLWPIWIVIVSLNYCFNLWDTGDGRARVSDSFFFNLIFLGNVDKCRQITQPSLMKETKWASYTCTIGFNALGIWPEGADGTDINSICRYALVTLIIDIIWINYRTFLSELTEGTIITSQIQHQKVVSNQANVNQN